MIGKMVLTLVTASAYGMGSNVLLRCSSPGALKGETHAELARSLLDRKDVLNALIEAEFEDNAPVMVPLCWSLSQWTKSELDELQWPPLVAAAGTRAAELRALAESHAEAEDRAFGRFKGAQAFLVALELAHCHSMRASDESDVLWLVPERARYQRSAPQGASLELDAESGDLTFVGDLVDSSPASRSPPAAPSAPNPLFFFLGDDSELLDAAPSFSISSGAKSNDELMLTEGWADEELACERFELPLDALETAMGQVWAAEVASRPLEAERRLEIVEGLHMASGGRGGEVLGGGVASEALLVLVRTLALSEDAFEALGGMDGCVAALGPGSVATTPKDVESRAQRILARTCQDLLDSFPTSAEEDEGMLQEALGEDSDQLSDHRRLQCLRSRLSKKRCLRALLERLMRG